MSPAQWLYPSRVLFFLLLRRPEISSRSLKKLSDQSQNTNKPKNPVLKMLWQWSDCLTRHGINISKNPWTMLENVGNIWPVMVTALSEHSKTNIVTMLSMFHPPSAQYLTNTCIVIVLPDLYLCSRTKQRKEQLSQEKTETILESAMLVNIPKRLKTCLILHWTRWKVYFQKPTQLR